MGNQANPLYRLIDMLLSGPEKRTVGTLGAWSVIGLAVLLGIDSYLIPVSGIWYAIVASPILYLLLVAVLAAVWDFLSDWKTLLRGKKDIERLRKD